MGEDYKNAKMLRAEKALQHTEMMEKKYHDEIVEAVKSTVFYYPEFEYLVRERRKTDTKILVLEADSVSAIMTVCNPDKKMCVLNFASYKHPGGMFIEGSNAQEEALCHESFLYNVLKEKDSYYEWNKKNLNKALYLNRALYTPNVVFERFESLVHCDVLTCAAPNNATYSRYNDDKELNVYYHRDRIRYLLSVAADNKVNTLILGAFGCGVFKQDPEQTALFFDEFLSTEFKNVFDVVVFAIPDHKSKNYKAFDSVFRGEI